MLASAPHDDLSFPPLLRPVKRQKRLIQEPSDKPLESDKLRQQGYRLDGHQRLVDIIDDPSFFKLKQGSPEWFEARKNKITGSIADTVLDNNSYQTYWQLVNEMAGVTTDDWIPVKEDGDIVYKNPNRPEIYTGSDRRHKDLLKRRNYLEREAWPGEENVVYVVLDIEHTGGDGSMLSTLESWLRPLQFQLTPALNRILYSPPVCCDSQIMAFA